MVFLQPKFNASSPWAPVQYVCDADLVWAEEQLMRVLDVQRGEREELQCT